LPVLTPEQYTAYSTAIGMRTPRLENFQESDLPQLFADRFGWPEMAQAAARVYASLTPEEQAQVVIFGGNYGDAGAIDFYGPKLGLPRAYSGHQNYFYWPPDGKQGAVMIALGMSPGDLLTYYKKVEAVDRVSNPHAMAYQNFPIYLCREPIRNLVEHWSALKNWR